MRVILDLSMPMVMSVGTSLISIVSGTPLPGDKILRAILDALEVGREAASSCVVSAMV